MGAAPLGPGLPARLTGKAASRRCVALGPCLRPAGGWRCAATGRGKGWGRREPCARAERCITPPRGRARTTAPGGGCEGGRGSAARLGFLVRRHSPRLPAAVTPCASVRVGSTPVCVGYGRGEPDLQVQSLLAPAKEAPQASDRTGASSWKEAWYERTEGSL